MAATDGNKGSGGVGKKSLRSKRLMRSGPNSTSAGNDESPKAEKKQDFDSVTTKAEDSEDSKEPAAPVSDDPATSVSDDPATSVSDNPATPPEEDAISEKVKEEPAVPLAASDNKTEEAVSRSPDAEGAADQQPHVHEPALDEAAVAKEETPAASVLPPIAESISNESVDFVEAQTSLEQPASTETLELPTTPTTVPAATAGVLDAIDEQTETAAPKLPKATVPSPTAFGHPAEDLPSAAEVARRQLNRLSIPAMSAIHHQAPGSPSVFDSPLEAVGHNGGVLGRSVSVRIPGGGGSARRRPSLSSARGGSKRRSIMLTSFTPPVNTGSAVTPPGSGTARSSVDSQTESVGGMSGDSGSAVEITIGGKTFQRSSMLDHSLAARRSNRVSPELATGGGAILLRPSSDLNSAGQADKRLSMQSIGSKIGSAVGRQAEKNEPPASPPAWMKEVQRRKLEREEEAEAEAARAKETAAAAVVVPSAALDDDEPLSLLAEKPIVPSKSMPISVDQPQQPQQEMSAQKPANARSMYRTFSASLGMTKEDHSPTGSTVTAESSPATLGDRQRSTSQTSSTFSQAAGNNGLFAAVTSFFGRASSVATQQPATMASPPLDDGAGGSTVVEFPAMRASQSVQEPGKDDDAMAALMRQLEAQNQQILSDNKARVFARDPTETTNGSESAGNNDDDSENVDWDFWGNLINDYARVAKSESRKLAQLVHEGIPRAIRGTVWQLLAGARGDAQLSEAFAELAGGDGLDPAQEKLIQHDLSRTFPKHPYFCDAGGAGQEGLRNVLRAYALYDPEVGYCQGLSFVVGPLLLNMPDEEAFCVLVRLMHTYGLRGHFLPAMDDLQLRLFQFDHVFSLALPILHRHFVAQGVEPTMYVSQWLMTLFAYRLPMDLTMRLFDVVFAEGLDALLRVSIAVLQRSQTRLLSLSFEPLLQFLNEGPLFAFYVHASPGKLVQDANKVTNVTTPKLLARLRKQYIEQAERRIEEEEESVRIRHENAELAKENQKLQQMLRQMSTEHGTLVADLATAQQEVLGLRQQNQGLDKSVAELESRVRGERAVAEGELREDMGRLAEKNLQLTVKNQQLEDSMQDMEEALVQIKVLYAESENQRELLAKRFDDLRRALK